MDQPPPGYNEAVGSDGRTNPGTYPPPIGFVNPNAPPMGPDTMAAGIHGARGFTYNQYKPENDHHTQAGAPDNQNFPGYEAETGIPKTEYGFDNKMIRRSFIRKVFAIILVQLLIVIGLIALLVFEENTKNWVQTQGSWLYWSSYGVFLVTYLAISCCQSVRRKVPGNYICLLLLTLSLGFMAAMISSYYDTKIVLMAMGICAGCCLGIIVFSIQTKFDFTKWIGVLCVFGFVLFFFAIFAIIFGVFLKFKIVYLVYSGLSALLFMGYLAVDIQMLMGGRKYEIDPEDYVFAATQIFVDVVMIFLYLLSIIGGSSSN